MAWLRAAISSSFCNSLEPPRVNALPRRERLLPSNDASTTNQRTGRTTRLSWEASSRLKTQLLRPCLKTCWSWLTSWSKSSRWLIKCSRQTPNTPSSLWPPSKASSSSQTLPSSLAWPSKRRSKHSDTRRSWQLSKWLQWKTNQCQKTATRWKWWWLWW